MQVAWSDDHDGARARGWRPPRASAAVAEGRVQRLGRQEAARRAADEDRLERAGRATADAFDDRPAAGVPSGHLDDARLAGRRRSAGRASCPARPARRWPRTAPAPLATIQGTAASVSTLLTTVGSPHRPLHGRVRRPLVGLRAPVLEGPQQDGLLAQHEGARQLAHLDAQLDAGAHGVGAQVAASRPPRQRRPRSRSTADGRSAR